MLLTRLMEKITGVAFKAGAGLAFGTLRTGWRFATAPSARRTVGGLLKGTWEDIKGIASKSWTFSKNNANWLFSKTERNIVGWEINPKIQGLVGASIGFGALGIGFLAGGISIKHQNVDADMVAGSIGEFMSPNLNQTKITKIPLGDFGVDGRLVLSLHDLRN